MQKMPVMQGILRRNVFGVRILQSISCPKKTSSKREKILMIVPRENSGIITSASEILL